MAFARRKARQPGEPGFCVLGSPKDERSVQEGNGCVIEQGAGAEAHDRSGADGALRARQHAWRRHLWIGRQGRGPDRQCLVARLCGRADRRSAHRAVLCLARLATPARRRRRLRHRSRLWIPIAELHGGAGAGMLGAHLDRHAVARVCRQSRRPVRHRRRAALAPGSRLSLAPHRPCVPRHPRVDVGQCALHADRGGWVGARHRRRHLLLGIGRLFRDPAGCRTATMRFFW